MPEPEEEEGTWGVMDDDEGWAMVYHTMIEEGRTPEEAKAEADRLRAMPQKPERKLTPEEEQQNLQYIRQFGAKILAKSRASKQRLGGAGPDQAKTK